MLNSEAFEEIISY